LTPVKQNASSPAGADIPADCPHPRLCPLNHVADGTVVCVRELAATPEVRDRLRELGLGEEQRVRLVSRQNSVICQVCNARVALSDELAGTILVEPLPHAR
jgi:Fe2+ transport system protein FeoA